MIGLRYWSTGIMLRWYGDGKWSISLDYLDDGFCNQASTQGELRMRYLVDDIEDGIDTLKADAEHLGIEWKDPTVYMLGDGEWDNDRFGEPMEYPEDWRALVDAQAARLGWRGTYVREPSS